MVQRWRAAFGYCQRIDATLLVDVCKAIVAAEAKGKLNRQQAHVANKHIPFLELPQKPELKALSTPWLAMMQRDRKSLRHSNSTFKRRQESTRRNSPINSTKNGIGYTGCPNPSETGLGIHASHGGSGLQAFSQKQREDFELTKTQRENSSARWKRLHQFLSEIGVKALRTQLGQTARIARSPKRKANTSVTSKHSLADRLNCLMKNQSREELAAFLSEAATKSPTQC